MSDFNDVSDAEINMQAARMGLSQAQVLGWLYMQAEPRLKKDVRKRFATMSSSQFSHIIDILVSRDQVKVDGQTIFLTTKGRLLFDMYVKLKDSVITEDRS